MSNKLFTFFRLKAQKLLNMTLGIGKCFYDLFRAMLKKSSMKEMCQGANVMKSKHLQLSINASIMPNTRIEQIKEIRNLSKISLQFSTSSCS